MGCVRLLTGFCGVFAYARQYWSALAGFFRGPVVSYTPNVAKILRSPTRFPDNPLCPFGVQLIRIVRSFISDRAYNLRKWGPGQGRSSL
jgi:hypothetical protein